MGVVLTPTSDPNWPMVIFSSAKHISLEEREGGRGRENNPERGGFLVVECIKDSHYLHW